MDQQLSSARSAGAAAMPDEPTPAEVGQVEEIIRAVSTAVRSYRLYGADSPNVTRFVAVLQQKLQDAWGSFPLLKLRIDEHELLWEGKPIQRGGGESGDFAFLFYKDGIRELTLLPGFEDEVTAFLHVVARAPSLKEEEDDLVTLLWEQDFARLRYQSVEIASDAVDLPAPSAAAPAPVDRNAVRHAAASPERALRPEDFQDTLYFLDEAELRRLAEEVQREQQRDLWTDVVSALFDRLEDGGGERQLRILALLQEALPALLSAGRLDRAAALLNEMVELASRPGLLPPAVLRQVRGLFGELGTPETLQQLVQLLEESPEALKGEDLAALVGFFPPEALVPLMRAIETVGRPDVRRTLEAATERLAASNPEGVVQLLRDSDPTIVAGAVRWVGRLRIDSAVPELTRLLAAGPTPVRLAAVDALQELRAPVAGAALLGLVQDPERDVRVAGVKALGSLGYTPARPQLEQEINSKRLRAADRSEKIAFFESFGRLAGPDGVALLDRLLNGKGWLGRTEASDIRACAALGLARVHHPTARVALSAAANDADPVVRSAVARALRGEAS